jgi:hypothetical protein
MNAVAIEQQLRRAWLEVNRPSLIGHKNLQTISVVLAQAFLEAQLEVSVGLSRLASNNGT